MTSRPSIATHGHSRTRDDSQLARAIRDYLELLERGAAPPRAEYCARFPEIAAELDGCLRQMDWIREMAEELSSPGLLPGVDLVEDSGRGNSRLASRRELGDFRLIRELGRGGMGVVYEAEQLSLGRRVALKVLPTAATLDPRALQRFKNEAQAAAALDHPHIVDVYGVGCERGVHYYAMRLIDGLTLADVIEELQRVGRASGRPGEGSGLQGEAAPREGEAPAEPSASTPHSELRIPKSTHAILTTLGLSDSTPRTADHYRTIAALMADAADALHHAHEQGIIHRDIKPSNLMLDSRGKLWITDFGLAHIETSGTLTATGDLLGTLRYMSPEQALGNSALVSSRSDVYSLGVTLYEFLALQPAFDGRARQDVLRRIASELPRRIAIGPRPVPRDLETIAFKSIAKDPLDRYATAEALGEDLRRFLNHQPIRAQRPTWLQSATKWCQGHRPVVLTTALVASGLLIVAALAATWTALQSHRDNLVQAAQVARLSPHAHDWRDEAWSNVAKGSRIRGDDLLRGHAAACLEGFSAHVVKSFRQHPASGVAFDSRGTELLLGGVTASDLNPPRGAVRWDSVRDKFSPASTHATSGPVVYRGQTPLQLIGQAGPALVVWDLRAKKPVCELVFPASQPLTQLAMSALELPLAAFSADGKLVAAAAGGDRHGVVAVWDSASGRLLLEKTLRPTALTVGSGTGEALATVVVADATGQIRAWSIPGGEELYSFVTPQKTIHCLALSDDGQRLASGGAGGQLTVWDCRAGRPISFCRGHQYDVYAVAFGPDRMTLASGGRYNTLLWDAATGRLLLELAGRDFCNALAFSPDGELLAASSTGWDRAMLWRLENGRGVRTLRGLNGHITKLCLSQDGTILAALSQSWQVALWDLRAGRLLRVLDVPAGHTADNAALAISPASDAFAFASSGDARLWELPTGKLLRSWNLPPAVQDTLAYHPSGQLLLFRVESELPAADAAGGPRDPQRVCRVRNLLADVPDHVLYSLTEFANEAFPVLATPDGSCLIVEGRSHSDSEQRTIKFYEGLSGKELWRHAVPEFKTLSLDPGGKALAISDATGTRIVEVPSGRFVGDALPSVHALGREADLFAKQFYPHRGSKVQAWQLFRRGEQRPLVALGIDRNTSCAVFSSDERHFLSGNADGSISLYDLKAIREQLASIDLGW